MRYTLLAGFAGLGVLAAAVPALAHHPFSAEFDAQAPLTLSGIGLWSLRVQQCWRKRVGRRRA
jgi:hypothetical protein